VLLLIVMPGNLPYSATKEQIEEHFAKIKPTEIRLRTYKGTNKFMGTCFVEFDRFDRMETCLKKYHHSLFPDAKNKKDGGRKINVELRYVPGVTSYRVQSTANMLQAPVVGVTAMFVRSVLPQRTRNCMTSALAIAKSVQSSR
jgi:RNA recognition motif-containing protein